MLNYSPEEFKFNKPKLRCNVNTSWDRYSSYMPWLMEQENVPCEVIRLDGEEFVNRINYKIETSTDDVYVFSDTRWGLGSDFEQGGIINSVFYAGESYSNVMWFIEEIESEPILQENGSYYVHTESLTIYYAYGVLPK